MEVKKEHLGFQLGDGVDGEFWLGPLSLSLGNSQQGSSQGQRRMRCEEEWMTHQRPTQAASPAAPTSA